MVNAYKLKHDGWGGPERPSEYTKSDICLHLSLHYSDAVAKW